MNVVLLPPADIELSEAIEFYNVQLPGLGEQFYREFENTVELLKRTPFSWRKIGEKTRRLNIKRFPYLILYIVDKDDIFITCIAHQHRNPRYFIRRLI